MANPIMQGQDTSYKPWGMLAGGMVGSREADQEMANMLALQESQLGNVIKAVEAGRASDDYSNPELEKWRQAKLSGEGMQQDAIGRLKQGTLGTDISAGNQKNKTEEFANSAKAFMMESDMVMSIPEGLAGVGAKLSPQMQQLAQQVGGIDRLKQVLPVINEQLKQRLAKTPEHIGKMEEINQQGAYSLGGHAITAGASERNNSATNATQLKVARIQAASREKAKAALGQIDILIKSGKYEAAATGLSLMAMQEEDPAKKQWLLENAAKYERMAKDKAAAGAVKPGAIDVSAASGMPAQQQSPSVLQPPAGVGQTKSGVKYKVVP